MEMKLPQARSVFIGPVDGKQVHKETYDDGSYSIGDEQKLTRYFPDGKRQVYESELVPVDDDCPECGLINEYILREEELPDGTKTKWDEFGNITHHETKGVEDTAVYVAKIRVRNGQDKYHKPDKFPKQRTPRQPNKGNSTNIPIKPKTYT